MALCVLIDLGSMSIVRSQLSHLFWWSVKNWTRNPASQSSPAHGCKWPPQAQFYCSRSFDSSVTHLQFGKEVWFTGQHGQGYRKSTNASFLQKNTWRMGTLFNTTNSLVTEEGHRYPWVPSQVRLQFQISFLRNIKIGCPCITYSLYPHITLTPNMALLVFIYIFSIFKDHVVMYRGNKSSNRMLDTSKNREHQRTRSKKRGATLNQTVSCKQTGSYIKTKQWLVKKQGATSKPNSVLSLS